MRLDRSRLSAGAGCTESSSARSWRLRPRPPVHTPVSGEVAAEWPAVGPPVRLPEVDLSSFQDVSIRSCADLRVDGSGGVNAVAVTFRADLHGGIVHTLDPWKWPASSWDTSVWVLPQPVRIRSGEALRALLPPCDRSPRRAPLPGRRKGRPDGENTRSRLEVMMGFVRRERDTSPHSAACGRRSLCRGPGGPAGRRRVRRGATRGSTAGAAASRADGGPGSRAQAPGGAAESGVLTDDEFAAAKAKILGT